ncbi:hypothetical protein ID866_11995 [Astraeus odoratus]|nr:hypothetical protein ID866_11995 [Astraeus odoratus]
MSSPHHTLSPHEILLVKTKAPHERMEDEWQLVSEVARAKEEAERRAKEDMEREDTAQRAAEAVEERANAKRRALEERLWEVAGQQSAMALAPPWVAKPSGRMTVGLWGTGLLHQVLQQGYPLRAWCCQGQDHGMRGMLSCEEDMEEKEVVDVDADEEEDEEWSHFAVLTHLMEEHRDTLGVLMTTLDMLSMEFYKFRRDYWGFSTEVLKVMDTIAQELKRANDLKEEEMGKAKGKGKEKAQEEFRRARTEDNDGDTEMGRAGSSLA